MKRILMIVGVCSLVGFHAQAQDTTKRAMPTQTGFPAPAPAPDPSLKVDPNNNRSSAPRAADSFSNNSERKNMQTAPSKSEMKVPNKDRAPVGSPNKNAISK